MTSKGSRVEVAAGLVHSLRTAVAAASSVLAAFVGTVLGARVGVIVATYFGPQVLVFGTSVFTLGLICAAAHSDRSAYRFAGVTLAIVLLVPRTGPACQVAFHRFAEVCIGIAVALILAVVWPEREATPSGKKRFFA
jgi:uncharacterized membrane protein YccC